MLARQFSSLLGGGFQERGQDGSRTEAQRASAGIATVTLHRISSGNLRFHPDPHSKRPAGAAITRVRMGSALARRTG
jgi:hypothetical protein